MGIATIGAFAIGEYPEGVAVMLFYSVGEVFQAMAVTEPKPILNPYSTSVPMK
jgi:Cd2+/Zn2+-exporting ATPase